VFRQKCDNLGRRLDWESTRAHKRNLHVEKLFAKRGTRRVRVAINWFPRQISRRRLQSITRRVK